MVPLRPRPPTSATAPARSPPDRPAQGQRSAPALRPQARPRGEVRQPRASSRRPCRLRLPGGGGSPCSRAPRDQASSADTFPTPGPRQATERGTFGSRKLSRRELGDARGPKQQCPRRHCGGCGCPRRSAWACGFNRLHSWFVSGRLCPPGIRGPALALASQCCCPGNGWSLGGEVALRVDKGFGFLRGLRCCALLNPTRMTALRCGGQSNFVGTPKFLLPSCWRTEHTAVGWESREMRRTLCLQVADSSMYVRIYDSPHIQ